MFFICSNQVTPYWRTQQSPAPVASAKQEWLTLVSLARALA